MLGADAAGMAGNDIVNQAIKFAGQGQKIDVAMLDCQVAILENAIVRYVATGQIPGPLGARHPAITPFATFKTKDGHIALAAGNDQMFAKVAEVLGHPEWTTDPRYIGNPARQEHWQALHGDMETALAAHGNHEWFARFDKAGIPCGPLNNIAEVMADPQVAARNMIVTADDPDIGPLKMQGNPIKLSGHADPKTRKPAPDLDADRAAILKELGL